MTQKRKILIAAGIGLTIIMFLLAAAVFYSDHERTSPIYEAVSAYRQGEQQWTYPERAYPENSGEALFLRGMDAFASGDFQGALSLFEDADSAESSDPALSACIYYYMNSCEHQLTGAGDPETVALTLEEASRYAPMANDTAMLWDLVSSISMSAESDRKAITLLESYLQNADNLQQTTWAWVKNCIAMLEYNNKEYARSIRNFYDVELALENAEMTQELEIELRYAKEYIANIYYVFEDYDEAAKLYQELIDDTLDHEEFHAYGCSINMASAYLEIPDTESARKAMEQLEENLSRIDEDVQAEVEASMYDVLANICIEEGDYDQADEYLDKAEAYFLNGAEAAAFLGGKFYIDFTRCKYLTRTGAVAEAQTRLEDMISNGDAAYYGLEKEIYELLQETYQQSGQEEKLIETQQVLLELDSAFAKTIQREYLEFSAYYQENNQLRDINMDLSMMTMAAFIWIVVILIILVMTLFVVRLLRTKNVTDQLTGLYNRKKFIQLKRKYKRSGTPTNFGVIMMDIDYFKGYNDTYGHPAGDSVLKEVAQVLKSSVRGRDVVIRYGGEEFLVILNDIKAQTAQAVCDRIHRRLAERAIPHKASQVSCYVTLSMGLCHQEEAGKTSLDDLINTADQCLYQSKEDGRNRTTIYKNAQE